ncbi:MAG: DUF3098 domain-containing protein [Chitinophagales bacterium]|nr:DUF3098 domain-containing protein [Chitinophagales bacterium]
MKDQETPDQLSAAKKTPNNTEIPLGRQNYMLILLGVIILVIGFILMSGGKYDDPNVFNGEELYSARRITLAPIVVIIGFAVEIYAIFHRPKNQ